MRLRYLFSLFLFMVFIPVTVPASASVPDYFFFTSFRSDAGLPHQQVSAMAFDHDGMLWAGTRNGLTKFDGYEFRNYYHSGNDESSIPHNFINTIFVDSDNNVWIGCEKEICRYDRSKDNFRRYRVDGQRIFHIDQLPDGSIICTGEKVFILPKGEDSFHYMSRQAESYVAGLAVSADNRIYIATNQAIVCYNRQMTMEQSVDSSIYSDFLQGFDAIVPLFFDHLGRLWIGRDGKGVMMADLKSGERKVFDYPVLTDGIVRCIAEDSGGCIWLGTEKGINVIDPASGEISSVTRDTFTGGRLSDNAVYDICFDSDDNIWVATYFGGINMMKREAGRFRRITGINGGNSDGKVVRRIIEPTAGNLWMASEDGGIYTMDMSGHKLSPLKSIPGLGTNVHELYYDPETSEIWIGTFRSGLFRHNPATGVTRHYTANGSNLKSNAIFAITRQRKPGGRLWIASTTGLMYYDPLTDDFVLTGHTVLDSDFVYCLLSDSRGNLWAGTVDRGLYMIDGRSGEIRGWQKSPQKGNLCDNYVTTLHEDDRGRILVGTNNSGMQYLDKGNLPFRDVAGWSPRFGSVCNIFRDCDNTIWITTSGGLFKMDPATMAFTHFTTSDGLPENQFNFASGIHASDHRIYCGTVNGLVSFSHDISKTSGKGKDVHLWALSIKNDRVEPGATDSPLESSLDMAVELRLSYAQSRLFGISYGIVDPADAHLARYQVLIEGLDKEWRDMGYNRQFSAMEMPPGNYVFKVRASDSDGDWDKAPVRELRLRIDPPFYLSSMAWVIYGLVFIALCYATWRFVTWRIRSRQKTRIDQLEREKKDELNKEKMEFFTNISHELKTPLSLIIAPLKQLSSSESLNEESRERLSTAIANTSKMVGLINELVTFNRVESGNFQLYLQKGNPLTLVETLTGYFAGPASEKDIAISIMTRDNGELVWFSSIYLERILSNLLSNAIKYTDTGGNIEVRASIEEGDDNKVYLQLEVKDNGIGIAGEEQENIFKKYYQTKRGYNASRSGWGIGLATVKKLVEAHKGSISLKSEIGKGSDFIVRINVSKDDFDPACCMTAVSGSPLLPENPIITSSFDPDTPGYSAVTNTSDSPKVSILLVEDNASLLKFLADEFSKDYNVYTATNGVEALRITEEYPVDIVVSDVMMPEMDGIELCEHLKNDLSTSHIPVILLTAKSDEQSTIAGFRSGAEAYVAKPFDPRILELRVRNILRARKAFMKAESNGEEPADSTEEQLPPLNKFDNEFISAIDNLIDRNIDNSEFSVGHITSELGISRSLLHIKMKSFLNSSVTDYIRKRRLEEACKLLGSGYNVSETAYRTGYSDPNYFTKVFKKEFGIPPKEYIATITSKKQ